MPDGKWIAGLTPDLPAIDAARRVLGARLSVVAHFLPLAAKRSEEGIEYVHQLRVATRRSASALKIFERFLPRKRLKRAKNRLRELRQAAGLARDSDVFQKSLASWSVGRPDEETPALDFLRGYAFHQRTSVQRLLVEVAADGIDTKAFLASIGEPDDFNGVARLGDLAPLAIDRMLGDLDEAIATKDDGLDHLHRIRILGKRLRYGIEVFADCYAPPMRQELYPAVEELQEILGDGNDSHVAVQRLGELQRQVRLMRPTDWPRLQPGFAALIRDREGQLPLARSRFAAWLDSWKGLRESVHSWSLAGDSEKA